MSRYSCGSIIPSECVPYTGNKLRFLADDKQPDCDANINDVFHLHAIAIDELKKATDVSGINKQCLTVASGATLKTFLQAQTDKLCAVSAKVEAITSQVNGSLLGDSLVTIDLKCLAAAASPCQVSTNTYKLSAVLNIIVSEICAIKQELGI